MLHVCRLSAQAVHVSNMGPTVGDVVYTGLETSDKTRNGSLFTDSKGRGGRTRDIEALRRPAPSPLPSGAAEAVFKRLGRLPIPIPSVNALMPWV